ncbi:hypothetical protein BDV26DRAFT_258832 [Aspergillus bertholletiae]|uniref:Uncharacterized protein n=1 Tax=Aspergillus bertholletiae TaxID=1226010 RepID=A0A5N7BDB2_9EURO|nr:hypothetical protein BDV26DRAFT_258832 [Aspergillus bertholletiae]
MRQTEYHIPAGREVTVEEIDDVLNMLASRCRFSGLRVRRQRAAVDVDEALSPLYKARGIKHCCQMIGRRRMSIERRYDGEYCQIHIDLPGPSRSIQIFSKSSKDSTADRSGIHDVIRDSLRLGRLE